MVARYWPFCFALCWFGFDRATKVWIERTVGEWETIHVIPGFFDIIHTRNRGMAFGWFNDPQASSAPLLLVAFTTAVLLLVVWLLWQAVRRNESLSLRLSLALVLGGALGNGYDRLMLDGVIDFLDFYWGRHHFPAFNVADSGITVGAALLMLNLWRGRRAA
jgi:signal peptidase II